MSEKANTEKVRRDLLSILKEAGVPVSGEGAVPGRYEVEAQRALLAEIQRDPQTVSLWLEGAVLLQAVDGALRALIVGLLIGLGRESTARIGAKDPDWRVRLAVAEDAWKLGASTEPKILALLENDPDSEVRAAVESWQKTSLEERIALFRADPFEDLPPLPPPKPAPAPEIVRLPSGWNSYAWSHPIPADPMTTQPEGDASPLSSRCEIPLRLWKTAEGRRVGFAADRPCEHGIFPFSAGFPKAAIREIIKNWQEEDL